MKKLLIVLLFLLASCVRIETYEETLYRWRIEYRVGQQNTYTYEFPGDAHAHYKVEHLDYWNVLLVYPYDNNMVEHCFKTEQEITVITFHLIN